MFESTHLSIVVICGISIALSAWLVVVAIYRVTLHPLARYPGPWLAKVSNTYGVYHNIMGRLHVETEKGHQKYGSVYRQGPNKLVFNTAEALHRKEHLHYVGQAVLTRLEIYLSKNKVKKSFGYEAMIPPGGIRNIFTSIDNNLHHIKRKLLSYGLSDSALKAFEPKMLHHVDIFIRSLVKTVDTGSGSAGWSAPRDMTPYSRYLQFDIMGEFGFGQSFQLQSKPDNHFIIDAVAAVSRRAGATLQFPPLGKLNLDNILLWKTKRMRTQYSELITKLVQSRMATTSEDSQVDFFSHFVDAKDPEVGQDFLTNELWGESRFLLIAGADTTATSLAAFFFYLTAYPECYTKLAEEVRSKFSTGRDITHGPELAQCQYLRACIDETVRMSSPVCGTPWREVLAGGMTCDGEFIPPGIDIGVNSYALHHNHDIFQDSHVFRPERWFESETNPPEAITKAKYAFSPFSLGTRSCAGRSMAYMELSITMARTIWYTDFRRTPGELGTVAEGFDGNSQDGRNARNEFQMHEHLTCEHDGPFIEFKPRQGYLDELHMVEKA